jgi:hypothetical protein
VISILQKIQFEKSDGNVQSGPSHAPDGAKREPRGPKIPAVGWIPLHLSSVSHSVAGVFSHSLLIIHRIKAGPIGVIGERYDGGRGF